MSVHHRVVMGAIAITGPLLLVLSAMSSDLAQARPLPWEREMGTRSEAPSLGEFVVELRDLSPDERARRLIGFSLRMGQPLPQGDETELLSFLELVLEVMRADGDRGRSLVGLLDRHPHPALADAYVELGRLKALVAIDDPRAVDLIVERLDHEKGGGEEIKLLGKLATPRARRILEEIASGRRPVSRVTSTRRIPGATSRSSDPPTGTPAQAAARDALRALDLRVEHGIVNPFTLDEAVEARLVDIGFSLAPETANEMFELYADTYPFVTADIIAHTVLVQMRAMVDELERQVIGPRLDGMCQALVTASLSQARRLVERDHSELASLAVRNAAVLSVVRVLLRPDQEARRSLLVPFEIDDRARIAAEVARVEAATEVAESAVLPDLRVDYTVFAAELDLGRRSGQVVHAGTPGVRRAVRYLGRTTWRVHRDDDLAASLLLAGVIQREAALEAELGRLEGVWSTFFGAPDDPSFPRLLAILDGRDGEIVAGDSEAREAIRERLLDEPRPAVSTAVVLDLEREQAFGVCLLGQRGTPDARILQQLLDEPRWPLSGHDLLDRILAEPDTWDGTPVTLSEGTPHLTRALLAPSPRAPDFVRHPAWRARLRNTMLGAWAELRSVTSPYVKDASAYLGISMATDIFHGWVEPCPEFFRRLRLMLVGLRDAANESGLFDAVDASRAAFVATWGPEPPTPPEPPPDPRSPEAQRWQETRRRWHEEKVHAWLRPDRAGVAELLSILDRLTEIAEGALSGTPQSVADGIFLKDLRDRLRLLAFVGSTTNKAQVPIRW